MFSAGKPLKAAHLLIFMIGVCRGNSPCIPSHYPVERECCPKCSPGEFVRADCSDESSTKCSACEKGTFNDVFSGLKKCLLCTSCDSDSGLRTSRPCITTQDTLCEPVEGFFCREPKHRHCEAAEKHSLCKPGQYITYNGTAVTDTQCADCTDGTFSDGTFSSCQPHTQCEHSVLLTGGTASADAKCREGSNISVVTIAVIVSVLVAVLSCVGIIIVALRFKKSRSGKHGTVQNSTKRTEELKMMESA